MGETRETRTEVGATLKVKTKNRGKKSFHCKNAACDQKFPNLPQARCPKAKPTALISHSVFSSLSLARSLSPSLSLPFVIIKLINIDWNSESQQCLYQCARFPGEGLSDRETAPDPPDKPRNCPFQPVVLLQNPTLSSNGWFHPGFPPTVPKSAWFPQKKCLILCQASQLCDGLSLPTAEPGCSLPTHSLCKPPNSHFPAKPLGLQSLNSLVVRPQTMNQFGGPRFISIKQFGVDSDTPWEKTALAVHKAAAEIYCCSWFNHSCKQLKAHCRSRGWPETFPVRSIDLPGTRLGF